MEVHSKSNDPWVSSPFSSNTKTHPDLKPLATTLSLYFRASYYTISSVSPLSRCLMSVTVSPMARSKRSDHRSLWKTMKQVLRCFNPIRSLSSKSKENSVAAASKASSIHSTRASPSPDHAYSAMNAEERDENLKEVITYCNKSMKSVS